MAETRILFLDGGLGTTLQDRFGVKFGSSTPLWSSHLLVEHQDILQRCQSEFGQLPVDIILTATYQASLEGFNLTKTTHHPNGVSRQDTSQYLLNAIHIAEKAVSGTNGTLALSLGPYGACMIPSQEYSGCYDSKHNCLDALRDWHLKRLRLFIDIEGLFSKIRYIALETIPRLDEIIAVRQMLDESGILATYPVPFWISCLYPGEGYTLPDGNSVKEAVTAMIDPAHARARPTGLGINCTKIWKLRSLITLYEEAISQLLEEGVLETWPSLVLYPDGTNGEVYNTALQQWELPEGMAKSEVSC
jgi:homocysteine S-methyltransferase